jgi:hypothetical protein
LVKIFVRVVSAEEAAAASILVAEVDEEDSDDEEEGGARIRLMARMAVVPAASLTRALVSSDQTSAKSADVNAVSSISSSDASVSTAVLFTTPSGCCKRLIQISRTKVRSCSIGEAPPSTIERRKRRHWHLIA